MGPSSSAPTGATVSNFGSGTPIIQQKLPSSTGSLLSGNVTTSLHLPVASTQLSYPSQLSQSQTPAQFNATFPTHPQPQPQPPVSQYTPTLSTQTPMYKQPSSQSAPLMLHGNLLSPPGQIPGSLLSSIPSNSYVMPVGSSTSTSSSSTSSNVAMGANNNTNSMVGLSVPPSSTTAAVGMLGNNPLVMSNNNNNSNLQPVAIRARWQYENILDGSKLMELSKAVIWQQDTITNQNKSGNKSTGSTNQQPPASAMRLTSMGADVLSNGIQMHIKEILDQCVKNSVWRRNISGSSSYRRLKATIDSCEKGVPMNQIVALGSNIGMGFGTETRTLLEADEKKSRSMVTESILELEAAYRVELIAISDADKEAQSTATHARRASAAATSTTSSAANGAVVAESKVSSGQTKSSEGKPVSWWDKTVRVIS